MSVRLIAHVNRDDVLIEAWLRHYLALGVASFHLIAHGGRAENRTLFGLLDRYPVEILDTYTGVFDPFEKRDRLAWGWPRSRADGSCSWTATSSSSCPTRRSAPRCA